MSIEAISWAFQQDISPSTAKFVLVCLCDNTGMDGIAYPSLETLCRKTSQDRKTVIASLDKLCDLGLLKEISVRGNGVKEYQIVGLPDGNTHYVYRLDHIETGEFYIGVRTTFGSAETDWYMGSGRWCQEVPKNLLIKTIVGVYSTRKEAELAEAFHISKNKDSSLIKNRFFPKSWQVPKTEPVPKTVPVPKTEPQPVPKAELGSTENGTATSAENGTQTTIEPSIEPLLKTPREKKKEMFEGVDPQIVADYKSVRKAKRAGDMTETAMSSMRKEAALAGYTIEKALQTCCERGWVGFKAEWVLKGQQSYGNVREAGIQTAAKSIFKPQHIQHLTGAQEIEVQDATKTIAA